MDYILLYRFKLGLLWDNYFRLDSFQLFEWYSFENHSMSACDFWIIYITNGYMAFCEKREFRWLDKNKICQLSHTSWRERRTWRSVRSKTDQSACENVLFLFYLLIQCKLNLYFVECWLSFVWVKCTAVTVPHWRVLQFLQILLHLSLTVMQFDAYSHNWFLTTLKNNVLATVV